jgi:hypothetical protein
VTPCCLRQASNAVRLELDGVDLVEPALLLELPQAAIATVTTIAASTTTS